MDKNIEKIITDVNSFIKAYSVFDIESLNPLVSDNFSFKNIAQGEVLEDASNKIEFSLILEQTKLLFSKREIQIKSLDINNTTIAQADVLIDATMAISTPDGLRAGQQIKYNAKIIFTFKDRLIEKVSLLT